MRCLFFAALAVAQLSWMPHPWADQLLFDAARDWQEWQLPRGAVEITADGSLRPVRVRKDINAALNATALGGGIRGVGSSQGEAARIMDGDPATGWAPDPSADPPDWFVEIDLGRAVSAYRVDLIFAQEGPPFRLFDLLLSTGEHEIDVVGNPVESTVVYRIRHRFKENERHRVSFALDRPEHTPIRFVRVNSLLQVPGARLTEVEVWTIGDNLLEGLLDKGGFIEVITDVERAGEAVSLGNALSLVDGDLTTRYFQRNEPRASFDIYGHVTLDLGAVYWVDLLRIIGGVVVRSGFGGGIITARYVSQRNFIFRFYEVLTSDGSLSPDGSFLWTKHFSGWPTSEVQQRGMADHPLGLVPARFVRFRWKVWDAACAFGTDNLQGLSSQEYTSRYCLVTGTTEELQLFGEGYPQQVSIRSPLIDLGDHKNLNAVRWQENAPPGTRVEIRTRTGNQVVEQLTFRDKDGKEVTQKKWEKLIPSFRGPIDTLLVPGGDWSPWSELYAASGALFQSPSPRRYLELDVRLVGQAPQAAASLDWLAIDFTPPLAGRALGEIAPVQVEPGAPTDFVYYLRPEDAPSGFDRLRVEATTPLLFAEARVDGQSLKVHSEPVEGGFALTFPRPVRSGELVELRFQASVFLHATRFDVFLQDSRLNEVRQRVEPGDAIDAVESNTNVVSLPLKGALLANLSVQPPLLTPNGDGVNDELRLSLDLVNVLSPRPLHLRLFDLSGRLVREQTQESAASRQQLSWDGRDAAGRPVPPGLYLLEVSVEGDARSQTLRRAVPVAY
jgi:hypothetical protein